MNTDLALIFLVSLVGAYADPPCYTYETPKCIAHPNSMWGYEEDKTKFWQCVLFVPFLKPCASGLVYDPVRKICDYPGNFPDYPPCD